MAAVPKRFSFVAAGEESGDSDEDGWDVGGARQEPQVGPFVPAPGGAARRCQGRVTRGGVVWARSRGEGARPAGGLRLVPRVWLLPRRVMVADPQFKSR